jgi:expansin (peptidoglycan-binding protein)
VYPEPFAETDLFLSVRPSASKLIATDAASYLNTNASNSSGVMTITGSGFSGGQTYGAIFTF